METFDVLVAHGKESYKVECSAQSTVQHVMQQLEERAGVFVRLQKLIFKGKVLEPKATLSSCKIGAGAKIMLLSKGPVAAPAPTVLPQTYRCCCCCPTSPATVAADTSPPAAAVIAAASPAAASPAAAPPAAALLLLRLLLLPPLPLLPPAAASSCRCFLLC
jgi:hypothetical protein